jgi:hypothetical protein
MADQTISLHELDAILNDRIKPYEDRIRQLEETEKLKEAEIVTLRYAIEKLQSNIENLKQEPVKKPLDRPQTAHSINFFLINSSLLLYNNPKI